MLRKAISFEDREAMVLLIAGIIFILLVGINSVLYYYGKLDELFVHISLMAVYIFTALAVLYQALYTKRMVIESKRVQAWQIISSHLYHHIAASIMTFKLVARDLDKLSSKKHADWETIKKLFRTPFVTHNAPYIIQPYIKPKPGLGAGRGAEIYRYNPRI